MKVIVLVAALIGAACAGDLHGYGGGLSLGHGHVSHASIAKVSYVKTPVISTTYVKQPVVSYISKPVKSISYVSKPVVSIHSAPIISHSYGGHGLGLGGYGSGHGW
ncbi:uncharacterized protein LOC100907043 [Galendromus occidentalis]|uniref:Uncharacterized protein LOC100907043 n=1 Tax=Galendromus occidentalis TaxID=34638 RepID=A0AAJ6VZM6_9ACAR|nr:uncharacterized protein LOC100907043 [Galendromus occidentalis]